MGERNRSRRNVSQLYPMPRCVSGTRLVVLEAEINPEEAGTEYHFDYDTKEYKQGEGLR